MQDELELIAPAGNLEKLRTALAYGADAVYAGLPAFSLRARANPFDAERLEDAIAICRKQSKRLYVTLNILAHNRHLELLKKELPRLRDMKPDGLIVSDPGFLLQINKFWPEARIHLSTQANVTNWQSVKFWSEAGVKRVILARELGLSEIAEIHEKCPEMELEYFVHGAMCLAYSGRCYLSRYYTGRSANLGDCAQPCRWQYRINEVNRPDQSLIIDEEEEGMYILNSRDLCLLKHLKELSQAGVKHFKIEGRAKSVYYAAVATGSYRESIDCLGEKGKGQYLNWLSGELEDKLTHRGYSTGFLFGQPEEPDQARRQAEPGWELCGQVIGARGSAGEVLVKVHNSLRTTDRIEAVLPYYQPVALKILEIKEVNGRVIQEAHGGQDKQVFIQADQKLPLFTVLRRKLIP